MDSINQQQPENNHEDLKGKDAIEKLKEMGIEAKGMGTTNRVPKELAQEIANLLPDFIPHENFDNFRKMQPKDIKPPEKFSIAGAIK